MDPITLGLLIAGGSAVIGGISSWWSGRQQRKAQEEVNAQNIAANKEMMYQQRQWAVEDAAKQNAYNHPNQQMQRYKEAGLNPQLIYGSASSTPAATIRSTNVEPPKADAHGILSGIEKQWSAANNVQEMLDSYIKMKQLDNATRLNEAQILSLKAATDKTELDNQITRGGFDELVLKPAVDNEMKRSQTALNQQIGLRMPSERQAAEMNKLNLLKKDADYKLANELFKKAQKENVLKQADIEMLQKFANVPNGMKYAIELLRIALGSGGRMVTGTGKKSVEINHNYNKK